MKKIIFLAACVFFNFINTNAQTQETAKLIEIYNKSLIQEASSDYQGAKKLLEGMYPQNKNNYIVNLRLGWLSYLSGDYNASKKYYQTAIGLKKQSIESMIAYTLPLAALEEWNEVEKIYLNVLKLDEKNYTANLRLGQIYLYRADYNQAKKYLENVFNCNPASYEPNLSLGWANYYLGDNQKAFELFNNVLMLNPNDSLATEGISLIKK